MGSGRAQAMTTTHLVDHEALPAFRPAAAECPTFHDVDNRVSLFEDERVTKRVLKV